MGGLKILSDSVVHDILINLNNDGIFRLRDSLLKCLVDVSNGSERDYQPSVGVVNRPEGQKCLFRPFSSSASFGTKIVVTPAPSSKAAGALHGIVTLCDQDGYPTGIINAEELTGYRTTLSALIPYIWRRYTDHIVVFGAGKQALWHLRLALALRADEIKSITVVNRSEDRAQQLISRIKEENAQRWKSSTTIEYLGSSQPDYDTKIREHLAIADAIFCTVGTTSPLFPADYMTKGRKTARYPFISAVGSWQPDMIELDPNLLIHAAGDVGEGFRRSKESKGAVLVDDREGAMHHAGEVVQSKLPFESFVEVGEVARSQETGSNPELLRWIAEGLVVYKNIGVSTTDLAIGNALLALADERGAGVSVSDF
ncbi:proline utilization protein [Colletotrichum karsti]|uniref:Proline utilization protein n=1 Tax=Colletotrichum karsti TaxID=1095194 RepID=A0A9P6HUS5_9PEZI|nr:proline utilization protein [Colletotrichum karsti]KAF9870232.1 proline utilization protein [Colletotrichum karsti]